MNYYTQPQADGQLAFVPYTNIKIVSELYGFENTETSLRQTSSGRNAQVIKGYLIEDADERKCPNCGSKMHKNSSREIQLQHIPMGGSFSVLTFPHQQYRCPKCGKTHTQFIGFKAEHFRITRQLFNYVTDLLELNTLTLKDIAIITGIHQAIVKNIDKIRLSEKHLENGQFKRPPKGVKFLGIDEFKLHDGHKYATIIVDLETGHVLWIAVGKKKSVVYDFIEYVGLEWMKDVLAVACDMNSDFEEAFKDTCPHLEIVYDHFHIVKNFNDKVVSNIRKDEQKRLQQEGDVEAAKSLKGAKYILTSSRETLRRKDEEVRTNKVIRKGSALFKTPDITRNFSYEAKYDELIANNKLLFTCDLVKEKLSDAYRETDYSAMANKVTEIIEICFSTGNNHFAWFGRLLKNHYEGIISHAKYNISTGKIEGINQKIKTLRRRGYGYPDDEYFFLKIYDMSRVEYERNPKSHKNLH